VIEQFLSGQECQQVIELARPRFEPSMSWNVELGRNERNDYRTSEQCYLKHGETPLIADIENRIAAITHTPVQNGEAIQVARYGPGMYYKQHYDYFDVNFDSNTVQLNRGGQRIITSMCYLQSPIKGGSTYFPRLGSEKLGGHRFAPVQGRLLTWFNVDFDGNQDDSTLHVAEPVEEGEKIIFTRWIHQSAFF